MKRKASQNTDTHTSKSNQEIRISIAQADFNKPVFKEQTTKFKFKS